MSKLIHAGIRRMWYAKVFRILMVISFGYGVGMQILMFWKTKSSGEHMAIDATFFLVIMFAGIVLAIFDSLFVGIEYSNGTIRNKLMVGHTKTKIYLCNLIICILAGILSLISYTIGYFLLGIPMFGFNFCMGASRIFSNLGLVVLLCFAYSAIFLLITVLIQNKSVAAVVALLVAFFFLFSGVYIHNRLSEPQYYTEYVQNGSEQELREVPNKSYLKGTKRKVYLTLKEILPGGQAMSIVDLKKSDAENWRYASYSLLHVVIYTGAGIAISRKMDIK